MKTAAKMVGGILMLFATAFFLLGVLTLGASSAVLTAPFIWGTANGRRMKATVDMVGAAMRLASTLPRSVKDTEDGTGPA